MSSDLILIIEDNGELMATLSLLLQSNGQKVVGANTGKKAIELFDKYRERVKMIISDITIPAPNGLQLLDHFEAYDPDIPVVMMSGYNYMSEKILGRPSVVTFLPKPFDFIDLLQMVDQHMSMPISEVGKFW